MNIMDVKASLKNGERLKAYNAWNKEMPIVVKGVGQNKDAFQLPPAVRVAIPTGMTVEAPAKIYIDDAAGVKKAIKLVLGTQIVKETKEVELYIENTSETLVTISNGETLAQVEVKHLE
jgi:hypothetical protein